MQKHVIIVHGWDAAPESNWFPWLKSELEKLGHRVSVPAMPEPAQPEVGAWVRCLEQAAGRVDPSIYFVGHSLGCITIAHFLQQLPEDAAAGGCVFVAGFSGNIQNPATRNFYEKPLDAARVRSHSGPVTAVFSKDDPRVPLERAREFARQLEAKEVLLDGFGHFVGSRGVTRLPVVLETLQELF